MDAKGRKGGMGVNMVANALLCVCAFVRWLRV